MKIAFYINPSDLTAGGIFTYSIGILKLFIQTPQIEKIYLILSGEQKEYFKEYLLQPKIRPVWINRKNRLIASFYFLSVILYNVYSIYKDYLKKPSKLNFLKHLSLFMNPYAQKLKKISVDIIYIPMQFSPVYHIGTPVVTTMHDLQEFHFPEFFGAQERLHRAINCKNAVEGSDHIIVSFDHVKNDLIKYFGTADNNISVCSPPFSFEWFSESRHTETNDLREKFKLPEKFILYPAATWRHKNHKILIEALSLLQKKNLDISLVCTGYKTQYFKELAEIIHKLGMDNSVYFLDLVDEKDLIGLYVSSQAVIIPTLYEAGSAPLYEAMRYGTPVLASNVTSLPDSMGDNRFIFNPLDVNELAGLIERILTDASFRQSNLINAKLQTEKVKNLDYRTSFLTVFNKLLNRDN